MQLNHILVPSIAVYTDAPLGIGWCTSATICEPQNPRRTFQQAEELSLSARPAGGLPVQKQSLTGNLPVQKQNLTGRGLSVQLFLKQDGVLGVFPTFCNFRLLSALYTQFYISTRPILMNINFPTSCACVIFGANKEVVLDEVLFFFKLEKVKMYIGLRNL